MKRTATLLVALTLSLSAQAQLTAPPGVITPGTGASPPAPAAAPTAPAQPDPMSKAFRECVKTTQEAMAAKGQPDFNLIQGCLTAELKRQESKLSGVVARIDKNVNPAEKKKLDEANSAWRRFRDAECGFMADPKGAPPSNVENTDCLMNLTIGRVQDMEMISQNAARRAESRAKDAAKK